MRSEQISKLKVAFITGPFPMMGQTFIINQVADLLERGVDIKVFAYGHGGSELISERFSQYHMSIRTYYLHPPKSMFRRVLKSFTLTLWMLFLHTRVLFRAINVFKYHREAWSLRLLFSVAQFCGKDINLVHCHFGDIALQFLNIREAMLLRLGDNIYNRLKIEGDLFFVMSEDMKRRVLANGFSEKKVRVLPVSIDVASYPYRERRFEQGKSVEIVSVGRFVEKKGMDDLIRALAIVRSRCRTQFRCSIVGGGGLERSLLQLVKQLDLKDRVYFTGYMKVEDMIRYFGGMHFMVQASKTASDGDME